MKLLELLRTPALTEEFERLRRDLAARHIAVAGASGGEGVSSVAARLACSLADQGQVLLAEGNVRRPCLARELGLPGPGLLEWDQQGPLPVQSLPGFPGVAVLTAGRPGAAIDAATLPARLTAAAQRARQDYGWVVWDTPPAARYPDLLALAAHCEGVLVVVEMDRSRIDSLQYLRDTLDRAQLRVLGSLLNRSGRYWPRAPRAPRGPATLPG
ncbi:tyrosine-protein kinase family protein [Paucibacter soli]|uniref:tyrosine-protein kinase family protein n=1 Tax=Paucibacter soli TaxID=3133433 RepID=UPI0030A079D0